MFKRDNQRSEKDNSNLSTILIPPMKPEFATMFELLRDAEKYDNRGELDVSLSTLDNLISYISKHKEIRHSMIHS